MSIPPQTVADSLRVATQRLAAAGIDTPRLDAQLLLARVLMCRREDFAREPERLVDDLELTCYARLIAERETRRPLCYILEECWFYGNRFFVTEGVLVPRPETEMLVEFVLTHAASGARVADIGTGSGCIIASVAIARPDLSAVATDISVAALQTAARNIDRHDLCGRVKLCNGDLLEPLGTDRFDLIVSNPPYIPADSMADLMPEVRDYEPSVALCDGAGTDGLDMYRRLIPTAREYLVPRGRIAVEVGIGQAGEVAQIALGAGYNNVTVTRDGAGIERVVSGQY